MGSIFKSGIAYVNGGGNGKTLKWDEYQALPEAIKMNGDTYYISDIDSYSTDSFAPVIYSEAEREIGVWTDGKPLYERTFTFLNKSVPVSSWTTLTTLTGIDRIVTRRGCWQSHYNNNNNWLPVGGRYVQINFLATGELQFVATETGNTTIDLYITIQYTKTADVPGSGSWTPQGVPAHHYSTEEQIVGTWVDGSTMYEKTYVGTIGNYDSSIDGYLISADIDVTIIKELINIDGSLKSIDTAPAFASLNGLKNTSNWSADIHINRYGILLWTGNSSYGSKFAGGKAVVTIRYTKSS